MESKTCYTVNRLDGFENIRPLLAVMPEEKSASYSGLSSEISAFINTKQQSGDISAASFYLEDFTGKQWTGYNEDAKFNPGSLMKVPELISILHYEEDKPGILDKRIYYEKPLVVEKSTLFTPTELPPAKTYTIRQLLSYMIKYSDNNATILVDDQLDQRYFDKTLLDHKLAKPMEGARNYPISAKEISSFLRSIYNGSYLTFKNSEYAAQLLSTCNFKDGFVKALPEGTKLIHKFGEAGSLQERQLHESAIIYLNDRQYLLTVMTKGNDPLKLPNTLQEIAKIVYKHISNN